MSGLTRRALLGSAGTFAVAGCVFESKTSTFDSDHTIWLENGYDEEQTVHVWVVRKGADETVFEVTRQVGPADTAALYNLERTGATDVETFRVCVQLLDASSSDTGYKQCTTVETNECYGNVHIQIQKDGAVGITYAIC
ncbi:hypothetical protein [Haladaptatus sp. T7]|uniref:hypothetical protein n=1 Tax=Haladaptatus sp. T7 TaxID=2029368 RepID=UPI0021A25546|nr:hypothetical protein [Haladaptatus sp. T7]GKZ12357.1 hypothetical protein HAL_02380 [Haladaptatus sp. T7]